MILEISKFYSDSLVPLTIYISTHQPNISNIFNNFNNPHIFIPTSVMCNYDITDHMLKLKLFIISDTLIQLLTYLPLYK